MIFNDFLSKLSKGCLRRVEDMDLRFNIMLFVFGISALAYADGSTRWHDAVRNCTQKGKRLTTLSDIDQLKEERQDLDLVWTAHYITDGFNSGDQIDKMGIQKCGYFTKTQLDSNEPDKVALFSDCNDRRNYYEKRNEDKKYYLSEEKKTWSGVFNTNDRSVWNGKSRITLGENIKDDTIVWISTVQREVQDISGLDELSNREEKCGFIDIRSGALGFTDCDNSSIRSQCMEIIDTSTLPITSAYTTNYPTTSTERGKTSTSYITTERKSDLTASKKASKSQHQKKQEESVILIPTVSAVIVIIAALATIWYFRRRSRRKKQTQSERAEENGDNDDGSAHYAVVSEVDNVEANYRQPADAIARPEIPKHNNTDPYDSKIKKTPDEAARIDITDTVAVDSEKDATNSPVHAYNTVTVEPGNNGNAYDHVTRMPKKYETFNTYDTCKLSNQAERSHSTGSAKKVTANVHREALDSVYNHLSGP